MKLRSDLQSYISSYVNGYDTHKWFMEPKQLQILQEFPDPAKGKVISINYGANLLKLFTKDCTCNILKSVVEINPNKYFILATNINTEWLGNVSKSTIEYFFVLPQINLNIEFNYCRSSREYY